MLELFVSSQLSFHCRLSVYVHLTVISLQCMCI